MTPQQELDILNDVADRLEPRIAHKLHVMFSHFGTKPIADVDPPMTELQLRNFVLTAATFIDDYTLVNGDFTKDQRAMLAADVIRDGERRYTRQ